MAKMFFEEKDFSRGHEDTQKWYFKSFSKASDNYMDYFTGKPQIANYFTKPEDFIFNQNYSIDPFYEHIIDTNYERFVEIGITEKSIIESLLNNAINTVVEKVKRNYKIAIPQFYTDDNNASKIQLLLPLCLRAKDKADLALVLDKGQNRYQAKTVLTLEWAYINARRIVRPDEAWLSVD